MSEVRCRACGAVVPGSAHWCSLCFADLRTPAVEREPVSVPAGAHEQGAIAEPAAVVTAPPSPPVAAAADAVLIPTVGEQTATPATDEAIVDPEESAATWPCPRCGADVAFSLDACDTCGTGFLSGASGQVSTKLPLVGDMTKMSGTQRLGVGIGISIALMIVVVVIAALGGLLL
jgi:hypothetical protein